MEKGGSEKRRISATGRFPLPSVKETSRPVTGLFSEWLGYYRPIKKAVTLRLDADILAWFKRQGTS
jgi:uncharacterized protein (DUF4415 family)